jgi:hypothetical protein
VDEERALRFVRHARQPEQRFARVHGVEHEPARGRDIANERELLR